MKQIFCQTEDHETHVYLWSGTQLVIDFSVTMSNKMTFCVLGFPTNKAVIDLYMQLFC